MIIGREKEKRILEEAYNSSTAEFIALYGRRRVGKTFLIKTFFEKKKCTFLRVTGQQRGSMAIQLRHFTTALLEAFPPGLPIKEPASWEEAFNYLNTSLQKTTGKVVIFLDELPWLATRKSGLLDALAYYWNQHWAYMPELKLIVCGSSASWIINKILDNKGGLHNRITGQINLPPFLLQEAQEYLLSRHINLNHDQVLTLYMAVGGIPYYLNYIKKGLSASQNIQSLFFEANSPLRHEFDRLFDSLFEHAESYKELVKIIAQKREGMDRTAIEQKTKLSSSGGTLSKKLSSLSEAGFIQSYIPWGRKKKGEYYRLTDEYCLFYLSWVEKYKNATFLSDYWLTQSKKPAYYAWSGYTFETICIKHIEKIVRALNIRIDGPVSTWRYIPQTTQEDGAQIDLVLNREDGAITLCEIKYTDKPYVLDKASAQALQRKEAVFLKQTDSQKQIFWALIASAGAKETFYLESMISQVVTLSDLF